MSSDRQERKTARYISPLCDFGFKRLFGNDTVKDHLISFINSIFPELRVTDLTYKNVELLGMIQEERKSVFDVYCQTEDKRNILVEMQYCSQSYFVERAVFYSSGLIREEAPTGAWDYNFSAVYTIAILNFNLPKEINPDAERYLTKYSLREDISYQRLTDKVRFAFIEVTKFKKNEEELEDINDKWLYLLSNLHQLNNRPEALKERIFTRFFELAEILQMTPEEKRIYDMQIRAHDDYVNCLKYAEDKGRAEGLAEGREAGLVEGRLDGLAEGENRGLEKAQRTIARNLLNAGMAAEEVASMTGLSVEAVTDLQ